MPPVSSYTDHEPKDGFFSLKRKKSLGYDDISFNVTIKAT